MGALLESNEFQEISYPDLGIHIKARLNMPDETYLENVRTNCQRGLPQAWPHKEQDTEIAIVAGGWSLDDHLDDIRRLQAEGVKIIALAGTGKYLLSRGIVPVNMVLLDARPNNVNFIIPGKGIKYFVASQCAPRVFDALKDEDVIIWHAINVIEQHNIIKEYYDKWVPVQGGNTIGLRSLRLFQILGFHKFHVFGMDSCNLPGKIHHAYEQPDADEMDEAVITLNGRPYKVTAWQLQQMMEFRKMTKVFFQECDMHFYGDGLIANMIKEAA